MQIYRDAPNAKFTAIIHSNACGITMSFIRIRIFQYIKGSVRKHIHSISILDRRVRSYLKHIWNPQDLLKLCTVLGFNFLREVCSKLLSLRQKYSAEYTQKRNYISTSSFLYPFPILAGIPTFTRTTQYYTKINDHFYFQLYITKIGVLRVCFHFQMIRKIPRSSE